jgi:hypothetical protein
LKTTLIIPLTSFALLVLAVSAAAQSPIAGALTASSAPANALAPARPAPALEPLKSPESAKSLSGSEIAIAISGSLLSGALAVGWSTLYIRGHEKRKTKFDTLKSFLANRYDVTGDAFTRALNEIFVVFNESGAVMNALATYHDKVSNRQTSEDQLVALFKAMCADLKISNEKFNDSFFLHPFNTRPQKSQA